MARKLHLNIAENQAVPSWDPQKALARALSERARFLQNNPGLKPFQVEIDTILEKAGTPQNRMAVLAMLMEGKLIELNQELKSLNALLMKVTRRPTAPYGR